MNITLNDINDLELGNITASGKLDATAKDDLVLSGVISADSFNLKATDGAIDQTGGVLLVATGPNALEAGISVRLMRPENAIAGGIKIVSPSSRVVGDIQGDAASAAAAAAAASSGSKAVGDLMLSDPPKIEFKGGIAVEVESVEPAIVEQENAPGRGVALDASRCEDQSDGNQADGESANCSGEQLVAVE